ncbi:hypothetical protein [Nocardia sp. GAS34]|uniref:hypothetical protein n=1 Tax=unclassified Nocardia TaxID=2637762 RepID=UPI003D232CC0
MKRSTSTLFLLTLIGQAAWSLANAVWWHRSPGTDALGLVLLTLFTVVAASGYRRWPIVAVRVVVGLEFLAVLADRFGLLGGPGSPGVAWGDFAHFVSYTRQVTAFLPGGFALPLAVAATIAESGLAIALLTGIRSRPTAAATAALLASYAVSMTLSMPLTQPLHYLVYPQAAGMLAIATRPGAVAGRARRPRDTGRAPSGRTGAPKLRP